MDEKKKTTLNAVDDDTLEQVAGGLGYDEGYELGELVTCDYCRTVVPASECEYIPFAFHKAIACRMCRKERDLDSRRYRN